jgi:predicted dinucleotide-utilizing enzyme
MSSTPSRLCRVGIVGFGRLGQYLAEKLVFDVAAKKAVELVFVWNRSVEKLASPVQKFDGTDSTWTLPLGLRCSDLNTCESYAADIIVEVAHPVIALEHGGRFLQHAAVMVGSPCALSDSALESALRSAAGTHPLLIPVGALWGVEDLVRMSSTGALKTLQVTMTFHPRALRPTPSSSVERELAAYEAKVNEALSQPGSKLPGAVVLYDGPVRGVCSQAPNNVNTMACASLAALGPHLGFDGVRGTLRADANTHAHIIRVIAEGANGFRVETERVNPSSPGAVTGTATFASFFASLLRAASTLETRRSGLHFV